MNIILFSDICLIGLLFILSGSVIGMNNSYLCFSLLFICLLTKFIFNKKALFNLFNSKDYLRNTLPFFIIILITFLLNADYKFIHSYISIVIKLLLMLLIPLAINFEIFKKIFYKFFFSLSLLSLIIYFSIRINQSYRLSFPFIHSPSGAVYNNLIFYTVPFFYRDVKNGLIVDHTRINSIFSEAGLFASWALIAFIFMSVDYKNEKKDIIFICNLFLSVLIILFAGSLGPYLLSLFLILKFLLSKNITFKRTIIPIFTSAFIIAFFYYRVFIENQSVKLRFLSLLTDLDIFYVSPLFGSGFGKHNYLSPLISWHLSQPGASISGSLNQLTYYLSIFGIFFSIFAIYNLFIFIKTLMEINSVKFYHLCFVLLITASQPILYSPLGWVFIFYGLYFLSYRAR